MTLPFELGFLDQATAEFIEVIPNAINLDPLQLHIDHKVEVLGVPAQVAQKLHACTEVFPEGTNDRCHDLYDITLLEPLARKNLSALKTACEHVFESRKKHPWPPTIPPWGHWPKLWEAIETDATQTFSYQEARNCVEQLIADVADPKPFDEPQT